MENDDLNIPELVNRNVDSADELTTKGGENISQNLFGILGISSVSKADRIRERAFRHRIRNSNTKYLKSYLKG